MNRSRLASAMAMGSPFCEHKRLRTGCPQCKANAIPAPTVELRAYAPPKEERKRVAKAEAESDDAPKERKEAGPRGPGKPLMPTRQKPKKVASRAEAEHAAAWWVKKD